MSQPPVVLPIQKQLRPVGLRAGTLAYIAQKVSDDVPNSALKRTLDGIVEFNKLNVQFLKAFVRAYGGNLRPYNLTGPEIHFRQAALARIDAAPDATKKADIIIELLAQANQSIRELSDSMARKEEFAALRSTLDAMTAQNAHFAWTLNLKSHNLLEGEDPKEDVA